jgi:AhpD family alkylhydroperoxidase
MDHPAFIVPDAMPALQALGKSVIMALKNSSASPATHELINLRASQINGCSVCVEGHAKSLKEAGERDERIWAVSAWRESPLFTDAERAALALTEETTRLSDRSEPVSDEVWAEAVAHYDEGTLAAIVLAIASINVWNRLNAATRQVAGSMEW